MPKYVLSFLVPALLVAAAEAPAFFELEAPLATLGSNAIGEADFHRYVEATYPAEKIQAILSNGPERDRALEEYLDTQALVARARQLGIDREPRFRKAIELMDTKLLSHRMAEKHRATLPHAASVGEDEVKLLYERRKNDFLVEPRFTAHHVLVYVKGNPAFPEKGLNDAQARAKAMKALAELRAGKNWETVAKKYTDEVTASGQVGFIKDGQFGYFAPEFEQAVRTQPLGKPGSPIKSAFGYHVLQVEERVTEKVPQPFEQVKTQLREQLEQQRAGESQGAFMDPLREAVGYRLTETGKRDGSLMDERVASPDDVLAVIAGREIRESDFRWFLEDAFIPKQRATVYSRPGARLSLLGSYLDMLVLEANARKAGLDKRPDYLTTRASAETDLLVEFLKARDGVGPFAHGEQTDEEREAAYREYVKQLRTDMAIKLVQSPP